MKKKIESKRKILALKVSLVESKPEIWRRVKISDSITFGELHEIIQGIMGWQDYHLHEFDVDGKKYGPRHSDPPDDLIDEESVQVGDLVNKIGAIFSYTYDFGDNWEHKIEVENIRQFGMQEPAPILLDGSMNTPPEDSGGIHGYYEKLAILKNPSHEEYKETKAWMGKDFDWADFNFYKSASSLWSKMYKKRVPPNSRKKKSI